MKKILILSLVMSLFLVGCGTNQTEPEVNEVEEVASQEEVKEEIRVKLNSTEKTKDDKWDELEEGKELLLLNVTIKNDSDNEYEFMPDYFSLEVDGNRLHVTDVAPKEGDILHTTTIAPGAEIEGLINFTIDEGSEYKIIYDDFDIRIEL